MKIASYFAVVLISVCTCTAQLSVPTTFTASFTVNSWTRGLVTGLSNPDFTSPVTGTFTFTLSVPQVGYFTADNLSLDQVAITPMPFGHTIFSVSNVGLNASFTDGQLSVLNAGGLYLGITRVSGSNAPSPNTPSDFVVLMGVDSTPTWGIFGYEIDGFGSRYMSNDLTLTITSVPASAVPESSSYGIYGILLCLIAVLVRRKFWY